MSHPEQARLSAGQNSTNVRSIKRGPSLQLQALRLWFRWLAAVAPEQAADLAFRLWFRTGSRPRVRPEALAVMQEAERLDLHVGRDRLAGFVWGAGPTVLLLHGWGGSSEQLAGFVEPLRRTGHRVVAFDLPAHGRNPGSRTNVFDAVRALHAAAAQFGPFQGIVAHSFGALATLAAIRNGFQTGGLVAIAPAVLFDTLVGGFARAMALDERVRSGLAERVRAFAGPGFWDDLSQPFPSLIIHDRDDREAPPANAETLAAAWPGVRLRWTAGLGHYRVLRDPEVIAESVRFLAARRGQGMEAASRAAATSITSASA